MPPLDAPTLISTSRQKLQDQLKHPDDLQHKLAPLRTKYTTEIATTQQLLKNIVAGDIEESKQGIEALNMAEKELQVLKGYLQSVGGLCMEARGMIDNYPKIRKPTYEQSSCPDSYHHTQATTNATGAGFIASTAYKNYISTKDMLDQFNTLNENIEKLRQLLQNCCKDPLGPADALLYIHSQLFELELFRDETLHQASTKEHTVLLQYFKRLETLSTSFHDYIWDLAGSLLPLIRENQGSVIVRLLKIIEYEELADDKAQKQADDAERNKILCQKIGQNIIDPNANSCKRQIKNYRAKFFDVLRKSIDATFDQKIKPLMPPPPKQMKPGVLQQQSGVDVAAILSISNFVFEDLSMVLWDLAPRSPPYYNIFNIFVIEYHRHIYELFTRLTGMELEARSIIELTKWSTTYYAKLERQLKVPEDLLEPPLLEPKTLNRLQEVYLRLIHTKLSDWMNNLIMGEVKDLHDRTREPDKDNAGLYSTSTDVILFQMVNQQLDLVTTDLHLTPVITKECLTVLNRYATDIQTHLQQEVNAFFAPNSRVAEGLDVWIVAVANNGMRCAEFMTGLGERLEKTYGDKKYEENINTLNEKFMGLARKSVQYLIDIMIRDVKSVFNGLFNPGWYDHGEDDDPIKLVIATLEDYFGTIQPHLADYLWGKFVTDSAEKLCVLYCEAMRNRSAKIKAAAPERMYRNCEEFLTFFSRFRKGKKMDKIFEVLRKVIELLEQSKSMLFLSIWTMWKSYPDIPLSFVEDILTKREDLDKSSVREVMESWRKKIKDESARGETKVDTITFFAGMPHP